MLHINFGLFFAPTSYPKHFKVNKIPIDCNESSEHPSPILAVCGYQKHTMVLLDICKCKQKCQNIQKSIYCDGFWEYPSSIVAVCGQHKAWLYASCFQSKRPLLCHPGSAHCPTHINLCKKKDVKLTLSRPFQCVSENSVGWLQNAGCWEPHFFFKVPFWTLCLFHHHERIIPTENDAIC